MINNGTKKIYIYIYLLFENLIVDFMHEIFTFLFNISHIFFAQLFFPLVYVCISRSIRGVVSIHRRPFRYYAGMIEHRIRGRQLKFQIELMKKPK